MSELFWFASLVVLAVLLLVAVVVVYKFGALYLRARGAGHPIPVMTFLGMWQQRVDARLTTDSWLVAAKGGVADLEIGKLMAHYLASAAFRRDRRQEKRMLHLAQGLVAAKQAGIDLSFDRAAAIDLAGYDLFDAVQARIMPRVVDCPGADAPQPTIDAIAGDGVELRIRARVTLRANLDNLLGGFTEETILARIEQAMIAAVGSAKSHKDILAKPQHISTKVMQGVDSGAAFDTLSVDIVSIEVGDDVAAKRHAVKQEKRLQPHGQS